MKAKHRHEARLVVYLNIGDLNEQERDEQVAEWSRWIKYEKLDARCYEYGYNEGAIVAIRFIGADIDRVASALDMTAGDLLGQEFALAMGE
jgi:hypothetical protein